MKVTASKITSAAPKITIFVVICEGADRNRHAAYGQNLSENAQVRICTTVHSLPVPQGCLRAWKIPLNPHTSATGIYMAASTHLLAAVDNPGYFEGDVARHNPFRDDVAGSPYTLDEEGCVCPLDKRIRGRGRQEFYRTTSLDRKPLLRVIRPSLSWRTLKRPMAGAAVSADVPQLPRLPAGKQ